MWVALKRLWTPEKLIDADFLTTLVNEDGAPLYWSLVETLYSKARASYRLRPLDGVGIMFRAEPKEERRISAFYAGLGWENLFTKGLETVLVPGDHLSMVRQQPNAQILGQKMKDVLNRYETD